VSVHQHPQTIRAWRDCAGCRVRELVCLFMSGLVSFFDN
jgi:hypothetical protein